MIKDAVFLLTEPQVAGIQLRIHLLTNVKVKCLKWGRNNQNQEFTGGTKLTFKHRCTSEHNLFSIRIF